jgi:alginate O-acetyltransferase complex protein AlgI
MFGLVLMMHFGVFHLLSCAWRMNGVAARPLQHKPLLCKSLTEFWGRGWNTAFRDLTHAFLFRPLTARLGARWALFAGFMFSGLVHDIVISVPSGGGYGWPTFYFLLQASGIFVERSRPGRKLGLGSGWRGRVFMFAVLGLPLYGLFHPPFVRQAIVPFMKMAGG